MVISSQKADHQSRVDECFRVSSSENVPVALGAKFAVAATAGSVHPTTITVCRTLGSSWKTSYCLHCPGYGTQ